MRGRAVLALSAALTAGVVTAGGAWALPNDPGLGTATDVVGVAAVAGPLTIAGAGLTVGTSLTQTPGSFSSAPISGGGFVVSDLRLSTAGWYVTASYSAPPSLLGALDLGGSNLKVSTSNVVPDAVQGGVSPSNVTLASSVDLSSPVTVATTAGNGGSGVTAVSTAYKVRIPATATSTGVYAGTVTYTVASVR